MRTLKLSGLPWKATEADVRKFLTNVSIVDGSISIIEDGWCVHAAETRIPPSRDSAALMPQPSTDRITQPVAAESCRPETLPRSVGSYVAYVSVGSEEEEANALKLNRTHLGRRLACWPCCTSHHGRVVVFHHGRRSMTTA